MFYIQVNKGETKGGGGMGRTRPDLFQGSTFRLKHVRTKTHKAFQEDRVKIHFFTSECRLHICLILFNYDCA